MILRYDLAEMARKRTILSVAAFILVLVVGFVAFAYYDFTHNFHLPTPTPQQIGDVEIALKGSIGQAIFSSEKAEVIPGEKLEGKSDIDRLLAHAPTEKKGQGLIDAYRRDPEKFKHYAEMLDTSLNAKQVAEAALRRNESRTPRTSEGLPLNAKTKVDAWGNPFCVMPVAGKIAIVSGGPSHLACDALPVTPEQIAKSNRTLYAGPSDVIVLIVPRTRAAPN
ncbi:MAG TPA: hypothetical protein VK466_10290 [Terriglobales bacterium]|nr:hypothetical protein [Terriglobales bacterium]